MRVTDRDWALGTLQGEAWVSQRKGLPKAHDDTEDDFELSSEWQDYLRENRPDSMYLTMIVDDRKRFSVQSRVNVKGSTHVTIGVPAEMFLGDESKQDVLRAIKLRTYTWIAEKFGWPPPPSLPPLTARRTYRKNYTPPADE